MLTHNAPGGLRGYYLILWFSKQITDTICSCKFWAPFAEWGISWNATSLTFIWVGTKCYSYKKPYFILKYDTSAARAPNGHYWLSVAQSEPPTAQLSFALYEHTGHYLKQPHKLCTLWNIMLCLSYYEIGSRFRT